MDPSVPFAPTEQPRFQYELAVDGGYADRAHSIVFRFLALHGVLGFVFGIFLVCGIALPLLAGSWAVGLVTAVVLAGCVLLIYVRNRQAMRRQIPRGTVYRAALTADGLRVQGPAATVEVAYGFYRRVVVRGEVVLLQQRATKLYEVVPAALFPGDALAALQAAVERAGTR